MFDFPVFPVHLHLILVILKKALCKYAEHHRLIQLYLWKVV